jgi:hypothetical protein
MMHYLHIQAQPIINSYGAQMFNQGAYVFLPDEMVRIIDVHSDN